MIELFDELSNEMRRELASYAVGTLAISVPCKECGPLSIERDRLVAAGVFAVQPQVFHARKFSLTLEGRPLSELCHTWWVLWWDREGWLP